MREKGNNLISYFMFAVVALIWGLSFLFTKIALKELNPYEVLALRWGITMAAFIILIVLRVIKVNYKGKNLKILFLIVLFQPCLYSILECIGIDLTTASESSIMIAAIPIMVVVENALILRKKTGRKSMLGVIIGFSGVVCCIAFGPAASTGSALLGYLALFLAVTLGGGYCIATDHASKSFSAIEITTAMCVGGGIFYTVLSFIMGNGLHPYRVLLAGGETAMSILFLGLGCGLICYFLYNYNLGKLSATIASTIQTNAINIVGVISGIMIMKDPWGLYTIVGLILMIAGIIICAGDEVKS